MTCLGFLFVFHCNIAPGLPPSAEFCQIAKPLTWSSQDSRETKRQIDVHNRKWKALCRGAK